MRPLTIFLSRFIGLFTLVLALAMVCTRHLLSRSQTAWFTTVRCSLSPV